MSPIFDNKATVVKAILVLSLVCLVVVAYVAESSRVRDDKFESIKQHVEEQNRILVKRQSSSETTTRPHRSRKRRTTTTTTTTTQGPSTSTTKSSSTTTAAPSETSTTKGSNGTDSSTTKKSALRNGSKKKGSTTKKPNRPKPTKKTNSTTTTTTTTKKPMSKERRSQLHIVEQTSLDHILAGLHNWIKVINETGGVPFDDVRAGQFFHVIKKRLQPILSKDHSPDKLEAKYMDSV